MAHLVRSTEIASDSWQLLDTPEALTAALALDAADARGALIPLPLWLASRDACRGTQLRLGVQLEATDDPEDLVPDLARLELIAVSFKRFTDGRGYSIARLLRARYGYRGELRAVGDVLIDQLFYLMRVGFDAYALREDQEPAAVAAALRAFSTSYQAGADEPLPLFRRRHAVA
jgi:uncharacterized protein (DUF934 family)